MTWTAEMGSEVLGVYSGGNDDGEEWKGMAALERRRGVAVLGRQEGKMRRQ